jgi:hypothetical protein
VGEQRKSRGSDGGAGAEVHRDEEAAAAGVAALAAVAATVAEKEKETSGEAPVVNGETRLDGEAAQPDAAAEV